MSPKLQTSPAVPKRFSPQLWHNNLLLTNFDEFGPSLSAHVGILTVTVQRCRRGREEIAELQYSETFQSNTKYILRYLLRSMDGATHEYFFLRWELPLKEDSERIPKSLVMNSSLGDLDATENYYEYNSTRASYEHAEGITLSVLGWIALTGITFIACCFGWVGNGYIIWLLGFQMKRNCFTTFLLNLAIADFGFLTSVAMYNINRFIEFEGGIILDRICAFFFQMMHTNSHFLLTAISIDRCVAVLFPIWHRCSRPKRLSSMVCVLLWISSFLLIGSINIMTFTMVIVNNRLSVLHFLVTATVCLPLITLSTVVLFIKVCLKSNQKNQGRLLLMILISLLCFLILAFPLYIFVMIINFFSIEIDPEIPYWETCIILFSCLNSSINPVIYFLVGRKKGAQSKESMKVLLQKAFKEGEVTRGR
ncbi:mas-related G-protein coupled receptor member H-like [Vipera latastei]